MTTTKCQFCMNPITEEMENCPSCGAVTRPKAEFVSSRFETYNSFKSANKCPQCQLQNDSSATLCAFCNADLTVVQAWPPQPLGSGYQQPQISPWNEVYLTGNKIGDRLAGYFGMSLVSAIIITIVAILGVRAGLSFQSTWVISLGVRIATGIWIWKLVKYKHPTFGGFVMWGAVF